jgi:hypothetical protein
MLLQLRRKITYLEQGQDINKKQILSVQHELQPDIFKPLEVLLRK